MQKKIFFFKYTDYVEANFSKETEKQVEEGGGGEGGVILVQYKLI